MINTEIKTVLKDIKPMEVKRLKIYNRLTELNYRMNKLVDDIGRLILCKLTGGDTIITDIPIIERQANETKNLILSGTGFRIKVSYYKFPREAGQTATINFLANKDSMLKLKETHRANNKKNGMNKIDELIPLANDFAVIAESIKELGEEYKGFKVNRFSTKIPFVFNKYHTKVNYNSDDIQLVLEEEKLNVEAVNISGSHLTLDDVYIRVGDYDAMFSLHEVKEFYDEFLTEVDENTIKYVERVEKSINNVKDALKVVMAIDAIKQLGDKQ